jgi:hypothetical protein
VKAVKGFFLVFVCLLLLGAIIQMFESPEQRAERQDEEILRSAVYTSREFIKGRLRSPSTAEFASFEDSMAYEIKAEPGMYQVKTHVDAQNAFGAMLRETFVLKMERLPGDRWRLLEIITGSEIEKKLGDAAVGR